jgi:hypothetical protein
MVWAVIESAQIYPVAAEHSDANPIRAVATLSFVEERQVMTAMATVTLTTVMIQNFENLFMLFPHLFFFTVRAQA